jgi:hypothetical protein
VILSLIAFSASCTAAKAMMPTVEALSPEKQSVNRRWKDLVHSLYSER